jgi:sugar lactone lactonase YvrE
VRCASDIAVDALGNLYIIDGTDSNPRIRKVSNGIITTIAQLTFPNGGIATDSSGNLYVSDSDSLVRKVSGGTVTTIAGSSVKGFSGDGGPATAARLHGTEGVAVDPLGNIYFADSTNHRVRFLSVGLTITGCLAGHDGFRRVYKKGSNRHKPHLGTYNR